MPDSTNNKFTKINYLGKNFHAYRTGDMAKINKNLEIEFVRKN